MNINDLISVSTSSVSGWENYIAFISYSFLTSLIVFLAYRLFANQIHYDKSFGLTLILVSVIVTSIILTLGSNIALSLGLIGSLSIIRFRTAIKGPLELAFLFWSIAVGLSMGSKNFEVGIVTSIFILLILWVSNYVGFLSLEVGRYLIIVKVLNNSKSIDELRSLLSDLGHRFRIRSYINLNEKESECIIELPLTKKGFSIDKLANKIAKIKGVITFSVISPDTLSQI